MTRLFLKRAALILGALCIVAAFLRYKATDADPCAFAVLEARKLKPVSGSERPQIAGQTFYVLGDWGMGNDEQRAVAKMLKGDLAGVQINPSSSYLPFVVSTGDNVYPRGLTQGESSEPNREILRKVFGSMYDSVLFDGKPLTFHLIPGNHDYRGEMLLEETLAEGIYDGSDESLPIWKFYPVIHTNVPDTNDSYELRGLAATPENIRTLPEQIPAGDPNLLTLAAIDSQYILRLYEAHDEESIRRQWDALAAIFTQSHGRWRMITGHHPLASHSHHGVPHSSLELWMKHFDGFSLQHQDSPTYQQFALDFKAFLKKFGIHFYMAGHDHTLQLLDIDGNSFQIISGAGAEVRTLYRCQDTIFAESKLGLVRFDLNEDDLWLEYLMVDPTSTAPQTIMYHLSAAAFAAPEAAIGQ